MGNLKKLVIATTLTLVIAGTAIADCPTPTPGEVNGPPCTGTQQIIDGSADQATSTITTELEIFVLDIVIGGLENLLTVN